ncbi:winged helix-turn-helix domain-containing protein [Geodermatophilus aquaeductus]|uniref:Helix-turn-helix domain-containing protein n=1 Tax=Geodermatophilus aquaeductus TaxID=1564161 RepID=A0A521CGP8_9ACTN|nr:winged helix-turn-helix domain-containing protein [Geodermatophilus aquaeductus]SMO58582.1 Helix-turn-helix domain-containing protein [Geodermatophilus aquaeductus]
MGEFVVDADVMARARFGTSQLTETLAGLRMLLSAQVPPWHRPWHDAHAAALRARLDDDPVGAALLRAAFGRTWTADFLTVPPTAPDLTLDEELTYLESLDDDAVRADLEVATGPVPPELSATGLARTAAGLLRWTWAHTIRDEWPRRRRVLRADVVARTARLSSGGWSGAIDGLAPGVRWLAHGRLQVNAHPYPPRDIRGRDLLFIAAHSRGSWVSWRLPDTFAVVYPVTGALAAGPAPLPEPLVRLLGRARARVLAALDAPRSTTALVAGTGLPLGSVGGHLRVLLDAGLLERRRSGREVLYWRSDAGQALLEASPA